MDNRFHTRARCFSKYRQISAVFLYIFLFLRILFFMFLILFGIPFFVSLKLLTLNFICLLSCQEKFNAGLVYWIICITLNIPQNSFLSVILKLTELCRSKKTWQPYWQKKYLIRAIAISHF